MSFLLPRFISRVFHAPFTPLYYVFFFHCYFFLGHKVTPSNRFSPKLSSWTSSASCIFLAQNELPISKSGDQPRGPRGHRFFLCSTRAHPPSPSMYDWCLMRLPVEAGFGASVLSSLPPSTPCTEQRFSWMPQDFPLLDGCNVPVKLILSGRAVPILVTLAPGRLVCPAFGFCSGRSLLLVDSCPVLHDHLFVLRRLNLSMLGPSRKRLVAFFNFVHDPLCSGRRLGTRLPNVPKFFWEYSDHLIGSTSGSRPSFPQNFD